MKWGNEMGRNKITWKLTVLITLLMSFLIGIAVLVQFFVVSRAYMITDYTQKRVDILLERAADIDETGFSHIAYNDTDSMKRLLDRYEQENSACCFLLDVNNDVVAQSEGTADLKKECVAYVQELFQTGNIYQYAGEMFRIKNGFGLPMRYVGIYYTIFPQDWRASNRGVLYFVAVTKEVYTGENYRLLVKYCFLLLLVVLLLSAFFSALFARFITKPVLRIRDSALRMSSLDFSCQCEYHKKDELGELSDSLNFLSQKLGETIRQLEDANKELKKSLDKQNEIDKMRKNFIASASHEFKTPLTLLRGYVEMIQDHRLPQEEQENAREVMMSEIDRMDGLVSKMLDISFMESDVFELHTTPFELGELLRRCAGEFRQKADEMGIDLRVGCFEDTCTVTADKEGIRQVMSNLLSNAFKNTAKRGIVEIKVQNVEEGIMICVFNQGANIGEEDIDKIWVPFYRADKARARESGGTGLGLSICSEILSRHGSHYGVRNMQDGVEFFFTLAL